MPAPDFKEIRSRFPDAIWDGTSPSRPVSRYEQKDAPDGFDRAQMVSEIIATQQAILDGVGQGGSGVPENFTGIAYYKDGEPYVLEINPSLIINENMGFDLENGPYFESAEIAVAATQDLQNVTVNTLLDVIGDLRVQSANAPEDTATVDAWAKVLIGSTEYRIPLYEAGNPS